MKKNTLMLAVFAAIFAMNCAVSMADDSTSYEITITHTNAQGITMPFLDKELSFSVSFRRGSDLAVSDTVKANTDTNGQATLTVNPGARPGFEYAGIELFCAKLDGPHYCNGVFPTKNNSLNPTDDASAVKYNCKYSVLPAQDDVPNLISVDCTDK